MIKTHNLKDIFVAILSFGIPLTAPKVKRLSSDNHPYMVIFRAQMSFHFNQRFIEAVLVPVIRHKKLNLTIKF